MFTELYLTLGEGSAPRRELKCTLTVLSLSAFFTMKSTCSNVVQMHNEVSFSDGQIPKGHTTPCCYNSCLMHLQCAQEFPFSVPHQSSPAQVGAACRGWGWGVLPMGQHLPRICHYL